MHYAHVQTSLSVALSDMLPGSL